MKCPKCSAEIKMPEEFKKNVPEDHYGKILPMMCIRCGYFGTEKQDFTQALLEKRTEKNSSLQDRKAFAEGFSVALLKYKPGILSRLILLWAKIEEFVMPTDEVEEFDKLLKLYTNGLKHGHKTQTEKLQTI